MKPSMDFQLHEVLPGSRVTGRNCGADIPLGAVFTGLYRRDFPTRLPGEDALDAQLVFVCDVSLQLVEVEMYHRRIEFISSGLTALLTLSGENLDTVSQLLSVAAAHTYYSLRTDHPSICPV